jgi:hypothetical protein
VDARQPAEIYIAGQFVQRAPLRQQMPPGRYAINVVAEDGRRRMFEVDIESGKRVKRVWDFDRQEWR